MKWQSKQWQSVKISDDEIVELYWQRDEVALQHTDAKYKSYLQTIAYNILRDARDCEECISDTYLGAWNSIPPYRPHTLKAYLTAIMRRVAIHRYHNNRRKRVIPSEMTVSLSELEIFLSNENGVEEEFDAINLGKIISKYVYSLSQRRRFIFMSRYYMADSVRAIADMLHISRQTVHKELSIIKMELKEILEREGYHV